MVLAVTKLVVTSSICGPFQFSKHRNELWYLLLQNLKVNPAYPDPFNFLNMEVLAYELIGLTVMYDNTVGMQIHMLALSLTII